MRAVLPGLILILIQGLAQAEEILKFGVVPQQSPSRLITSWTPLIRHISAVCACKIIFVTAPDTSIFEANVKNGEYDLAYMNPMHFVRSGKPAGYEALVRESKRQLRGLLVVKKDSAIKNLDQLKNQKIAMPGPTSFAATVLVQNLFAQKNIAVQPIFVNSHESVYMNVIAGLFPAGGAINRTFDALPESEKSQLKILATTRGVTAHPIAVLKKVDPKTKALLQKALIQLQESEEGKKILKDLDFYPLIAAKDSDWSDVEKILPAMGKLH